MCFSSNSRLWSKTAFMRCPNLFFNFSNTWTNCLKKLVKHQPCDPQSRSKTHLQWVRSLTFSWSKLQCVLLLSCVDIAGKTLFLHKLVFPSLGDQKGEKNLVINLLNIHIFTKCLCASLNWQNLCHCSKQFLPAVTKRATTQHQSLYLHNQAINWITLRVKKCAGCQNVAWQQNCLTLVITVYATKHYGQQH